MLELIPTNFNSDFTSSGNVLFEGESEEDIKVTLIDWGKTEEVAGRSKADIVSCTACRPMK